ncbi:HAMP domain-containing histidine kinase [Actinomadura barringtoniae]|uniref:histidine kinase n=1 Tax=Actinomadura barringtoniae TaxID=1427535 RepID=A0A939PC07_9ACTN|nr:HAMP domain-containing sensor histidine kinase [Actinomadura barringtoniae]MBO2450042.1 HAMP domain-containing histidine kinase [Actinomadura barringtoniae]
MRSRSVRPRSVRPRSVRARTTLAATLVVTLAFAAAGALLYVLLHSELTSEVGDRTELTARRVADSESAGSLKGPLPRAGEGVDLIQVVSEAGGILKSNGLISEGQPLIRIRPRPGQDSVSTVVKVPELARGHPVQVVVVRTQSQDGPVYVYAATALTDTDKATRAILIALLIAAPVFITMVAVLTWWTTGRALRPVESIRAELAAITARALGRRVPEPRTGDEVAALAATVNQTLDRLDRAGERQRQFVSDASHELRNPIATVRLQLETMLAEDGDAESLRAAIREALTDTERLQAIAADLLLLAQADSEIRSESGGAARESSGVRRRRETLDLGLLAAEEVARRQGNRVPIRLDVADGVLTRGDERQLSRVLENLIANAQRYATARVTVRVAADAGAGEAVVEVVDDGPGIPPEDRERVFERFTRLDAARGRQTGGAGLGLAIAREVAIAHGGTLRVGESAAGARLVLRVPLPAPAPPDGRSP